MMEGVFLVYAVRRLGLAPGAIGVVFAVGNVGLLAGAALAGPVAGRLGLGRALVASAGLQGMGLLLVPLAAMAPLPLLVAGQLLRSFGVVVYNIHQVSLRQAVTPERMLGRTNAVMRFVGLGTLPLGNVLGGGLATLVGLAPTLWLAALAGLLAVLALLLSPVRVLPVMPQPHG